MSVKSNWHRLPLLLVNNAGFFYYLPLLRLEWSVLDFVLKSGVGFWGKLVTFDHLKTRDTLIPNVTGPKWLTCFFVNHHQFLKCWVHLKMLTRLS